MENIIPIESQMEHETAEVICVACHYRYQCVWPSIVPLRNLECGECGAIGSIIKTGQTQE